MAQRILVAHASRAGSTAEVAEFVGRVLRESGCEVDVASVKEVQDLVGYDGVVLGSAIWAFKPLPEAMQFAEARRDALAAIPVAYFVLCEILRDDTPENRTRARGFIAPLERLKAPVSVGVFAGKRDLSTLNPIVRWLLMHLFPIQEGDWRNWDRIRAWAAELPPRLTRHRGPLAAVG